MANHWTDSVKNMYIICQQHLVKHGCFHSTLMIVLYMHPIDSALPGNIAGCNCF